MSSSIRMVMRVFPLRTETTGPRFALRKSYSRFMVFLVLAFLPRSGRTRRDQAHIVFAPGVDHDDYAAQIIPSESDPAFFLIRGGIAHRKSKVIFEHGHGVGEADAMLGEVRASLGRIPLIAHTLSICTFVHTCPSLEIMKRLKVSALAAKGVAAPIPGTGGSYEFQVTRDNCFLRDSHSAPESRRGATSIRRGVSLNTPAAVHGRPSRVRYSRTFSASAMLVKEASWTIISARNFRVCISSGSSSRWRQSEATRRPKGISSEALGVSRSSGWPEVSTSRSHSKVTRLQPASCIFDR